MMPFTLHGHQDAGAPLYQSYQEPFNVELSFGRDPSDVTGANFNRTLFEVLVGQIRDGLEIKVISEFSGSEFP
jgi:hypothetical protein